MRNIMRLEIWMRGMRPYWDSYLVELHRVDGLARVVLGLLEAFLEHPIQHLALGLLRFELVLEVLFPLRGLARKRRECLVQTDARALPRRLLVGDHGLESG